MPEQAGCFVDPAAAQSCQPLSQFWACLGLVTVQFALDMGHGCALEATDRNSELDFTFFFLLVSKTSVTRNAVLLYALVGKERIIRRQHF